MKPLLILLITFALSSCVDSYERVKDLEKKFPNCKITGVESSSSLPYHFLVTDSAGRMTGIMYYPFSATKIESITRIN